jgi:hypothetical protein
VRIAAFDYHQFMPPCGTQGGASAIAMAFHVNADYPPPKTWQQFEELCADIYAADWSDPALQRYGRAGQVQHGVDIVARHGNRWPVGLQCRKKSQWPVVSFSMRELDEAVKDALKFRPPLQSFYILTTALVDAKLQAHARKITAQHQQKDCSMSMSWAGPRSFGAPRFTAPSPTNISVPAARRVRPCWRRGSHRANRSPVDSA